MFLRVWLISGRRPSPRRDERIARQRPCSLSCVHHVAPLACVFVCVPYSVFLSAPKHCLPSVSAAPRRHFSFCRSAPLCCQQADWSRRADRPASPGPSVWGTGFDRCRVFLVVLWINKSLCMIYAAVAWHEQVSGVCAWLNMVCSHSLVAFFCALV